LIEKQKKTTMITISSPNNPLIKHVKQLHAKKGRAAHHQFIAEGKRVCTTLLLSNVYPDFLFITEDFHKNNILKNGKEWAEYHVEKERIYLVTDELLRSISCSESPSGVLGVFPIPDEPLDPLSPGIVLAQIADPGNMGTLIRSAAAMKAETVVVVEGCDPWSPKVVQASSGTIAQVQLYSLTWQELLIMKRSIALTAMVVSGGQNPSKFALRDTLLVVGNEAHGLPDEWRAQCEFAITLPMPGGTESLNAAIAGSIALYLGWA
jgi:TrmH family RNA methyltransferase